MTPEEKAKELIKKFQKEIPDYLYQGKMLDIAAKACAIILCDEMIKELENLHKPEYTTFRMFDEKQMDGWELLEFWQQVKSN